MPVVIGRAVHLHPVVTIFAVLVGLSTFGVLGGLLGVPVAAALNVTFRELYPTQDAAAESAMQPAAGSVAAAEPVAEAAIPAAKATRPAESAPVIDPSDTPP